MFKYVKFWHWRRVDFLFPWLYANKNSAERSACFYYQETTGRAGGNGKEAITVLTNGISFFMAAEICDEEWSVFLWLRREEWDESYKNVEAPIIKGLLDFTTVNVPVWCQKAAFKDSNQMETAVEIRNTVGFISVGPF